MGEFKFLYCVDLNYISITPLGAGTSIWWFLFENKSIDFMINMRQWIGFENVESEINQKLIHFKKVESDII